MAETVRPYRTFLLDARDDGQYLRATWHPHGRVFVISHWQADVCVAATRLGAAEASELIGLLATGLADAATPPAPTSTASPEPTSTAPPAPVPRPRTRRTDTLTAAIRRRWPGRAGPT